MKILFRDLGWSNTKDLKANGFQQWRAARTSKLGAKTINEYLNSLNVFCNWMVKNGRLPENPFRLVSRLQTAGQERCVRRALTLEESRKLLAVAGERKACLTASLTG